MAIASADKNEACAALVPGANPNGGGEFSASGNFIRKSIRGDSGGGGRCSGCCRQAVGSELIVGTAVTAVSMAPAGATSLP